MEELGISYKKIKSEITDSNIKILSWNVCDLNWKGINDITK